MDARIEGKWLTALLGALFAIFSRACLGEGEIDRNRIRACPPSPNCVSSRSADRDRYIGPLQIRVTSDKAWESLKASLAEEERIRVVEEVRGDGYLRAEATSLVFGFVDDVELQILPEDHLIHLRSASRVGYWDLGVNRRRLERIAGRMRAVGSIK